LHGQLRVALKAELRHRVGDGIVQAPVQGPELHHGKGRIPLERQVGDGLAQVAVVVDDLVDGVTQQQQLLAMRGGANADLGQRPRVAARRARDGRARRGIVIVLCREGAGELVQEQGHPMGQLLVGRLAPGALGHLSLAPRDQFVAVVGQEMVHGNLCVRHGMDGQGGSPCLGRPRGQHPSAASRIAPAFDGP